VLKLSPTPRLISSEDERWYPLRSSGRSCNVNKYLVSGKFDLQGHSPSDNRWLINNPEPRPNVTLLPATSTVPRPSESRVDVGARSPQIGAAQIC